MHKKKLQPRNEIQNNRAGEIVQIELYTHRNVEGLDAVRESAD